MLNRRIRLFSTHTQHIVNIPNFYRYVTVYNNSRHVIRFFTGPDTTIGNELYQIRELSYVTLPLFSEKYGEQTENEQSYIVTSEGQVVSETFIILSFTKENPNTNYTITELARDESVHHTTFRLGDTNFLLEQIEKNTVGINPTLNDIRNRLSNEIVTLIPSGSRTTSHTTPLFTNFHGKGCIITISVTAISATPSLRIEIVGRVGVTDYIIIISPAITAVGNTILRIHPGLTPVANLTVNDILPRSYFIRCIHADADSITYSVSASFSVG